MDMGKFRAVYDAEQRLEIEYPGMEKETFPNLVRFTRPAPGMSFISYSRLSEQNADQVISEQVDYFEALDRPVNWKVYDYDTPPDLKVRLQAAGFTPDEPEALMALDLKNASPPLLTHSLQGVRRLEQSEQLGEVAEVLEAVWGGTFQWVHERLGSHLEIPGYLSVFVADFEGRPACCGWVYYNKDAQIASLWGGSTLEAARGRGLYTAVLAARLQDALKSGYCYLCVDASPMSRRILEKFGFELFTHAQDYDRKNQPATV